MKIRPANIEKDLPDIVRITNPYENTPLTVDQVRSFFQYNPPGRIQLRLVAVDVNGVLTGYGGMIHEASAPAGHFINWVIIDPAFRCQGIGAALWKALASALQEQDARHLEADVFDNDPVSLAFAEQRGFTIDHHAFASCLDLTVFDETPYQPVIDSLSAQGIRFCSLADFPDTRVTRRKLYKLNSTFVLDIPNQQDHHLEYPEFEKYVLEAPWFRREGQLLAVDGRAWVGLAAVGLSPEMHSAYNAVTGLLRAYRGRKIGLALKVLAARYARQCGARQIMTDNDSTNAPILGINQKLGYRPKPGKYGLVCRMDR